MVVVVLTACPQSLRGDLTRWLLEVSPGVYVGHISARIREHLWERIKNLMKDGRATMVYSARNEQHLAFLVHRAEWNPIDCDGAELVVRPKGTDDATPFGTMKSGWSNASAYHRGKKYSQ